MDLVESHVHIWTVRDPRFPKHPDSNFDTDREATPADLFAAQDEVGGVAWTVLIQPRLTTCGTTPIWPRPPRRTRIDSWSPAG